MGQASGKLTISHVDHKTKTEAPVEADGDASQPISTGQIINGDVTNALDLPSIDDDIEPITTKSNVVAEVPPAHGDHSTVPEHDQNGSVHAVEEHDATPVPGDKSKDEKQTKKTKNPLVWIHRRLSKRSSTSKKQSDKTEETAHAAEPNEPVGETAAPVVAATTEQAESVTVSATPVTAAEHQEVVEVASSLVDQVLSTAMVQQLSEQSVEHTPEVAPVTTELVEQQHQPSTEPTVEHPSCSVEQVLESVPPEHEHMETCPSVEEPDVDATTPEVAELPNGDSEHMPKAELQPELPEQPEQTEQLPVENLETEHPVMDTNNTNVASDEQSPEKIEVAPVEPSSDHEEAEEQGLARESEENHVNGGEFEHHDDAIASKLANLELTNGHTEQHHPTTNGVGGVHSDIVVNGD